MCRRAALLCAVAGVAACQPDPGRHVRQHQRLAFVQVTLVDPVKGQTKAGHTVVTEAGRIVSIGPSDSVDPPANAFVVQGAGRYLMPGLIDAHVHHFDEDHGYFERELLLYLANGVTSVRIMNGSGRALRARDRIRAGSLAGPHLVVCSPQIRATSGGNGPDSARIDVQRHAAAGYDCLKIYTGPRPDAFEAAVAMADSLRLPTAGHASRRIPLELLLRMRSLEHVEEIQAFFGRRPALDAATDGPRVDSIVKSGVRVVPTLGGFDFRPYYSDSGYATLLARESSRYVPEPWFSHRDRDLKRRRAAGEDIDSLSRSFGEYYERALLYTRFFHERGVRLVMGTDAGNTLHAPGFSAILEMRALVTAGLSASQALASAAADAADLLGVDAGRIEAGRASDLLLLRRNPLEDVGNLATVDGVLAGTRWIDQNAIVSILRELRRR
jgi:imidazolonepropionase-like amidohydrolase